MPFGNLLSYQLVFLFEIVMAEFMFSYKLKRNKYWWAWLIGSLTVTITLTYFFPTPTFNNWFSMGLYSSMMFFLIFLMTVISLKLVFNERWMIIIFVSLASYATQHLAFQFFNAIMNLSGLGNGGLGFYGEPVELSSKDLAINTIIYDLSYIFIYLTSYALFARRIKRGQEIVIKNGFLFMISGVVVGIVIIVNAMITYVINYGQSNREIQFVSGFSALISMTCCLISMSLLFLSSSSKMLEEELDKTNHILRQEQKQYEQAKQNIELINLKCHDLKHQIHRIGKNESLSENSVKEIEKVIGIYDSTVKTGNKVLDTILTEKSLDCYAKKIKVTCVIDGSKLTFMDETDIYTLFGNAFDNAIEAVEKLPLDKRIISLSSQCKGNIFSFAIRNYFAEKPIFKDGLPLTTKNDTSYHGFGMKSIRNIVEKYNGDLKISIDNDVFNVGFLFQLDDTKAE